jgi:hypothetical protein
MTEQRTITITSAAYYDEGPAQWFVRFAINGTHGLVVYGPIPTEDQAKAVARELVKIHGEALQRLADHAMILAQRDAMLGRFGEAKPVQMMPTGPGNASARFIGCQACNGTGQVLDSIGELRPCSRCNGDLWRAWANQWRVKPSPPQDQGGKVGGAADAG